MFEYLTVNDDTATFVETRFTEYVYALADIMFPCKMIVTTTAWESYTLQDIDTLHAVLDSNITRVEMSNDNHGVVISRGMLTVTRGWESPVDIERDAQKVTYTFVETSKVTRKDFMFLTMKILLPEDDKCVLITTTDNKLKLLRPSGVRRMTPYMLSAKISTRYHNCITTVTVSVDGTQKIEVVGSEEVFNKLIKEYHKCLDEFTIIYGIHSVDRTFYHISHSEGLYNFLDRVISVEDFLDLIDEVGGRSLSYEEANQAIKSGEYNCVELDTKLDSMLVTTKHGVQDLRIDDIFYKTVYTFMDEISCAEANNTPN